MYFKIKANLFARFLQFHYHSVSTAWNCFRSINNYLRYLKQLAFQMISSDNAQNFSCLNLKQWAVVDSAYHLTDLKKSNLKQQHTKHFVSISYKLLKQQTNYWGFYHVPVHTLITLLCAVFCSTLCCMLNAFS